MLTQTILPSYQEIAINELDRIVLLSSSLFVLRLYSFLFKPRLPLVSSHLGYAIDASVQKAEHQFERL
jgi:hypothetical protein